MESKSPYNPLGILKADMQYNRVDCATDLIRVALPIQEKLLHFQPFIRDSSVSLIKDKSLDLFGEMNKGIPRYLTFLGNCLKPH